MIKKKLLLPAVLALGLIAAGCTFPDINFGGTTNPQATQGAGGGGQAAE